MKEFGCVWRWTNTHQQMADGLTKLSARQAFAEKLRRGVHALKSDPDYTAGKEIPIAQRQEREQELNDYAEANAAEDEEETANALRRVAKDQARKLTSAAKTIAQIAPASSGLGAAHASELSDGRRAERETNYSEEMIFYDKVCATLLMLLLVAVGVLIMVLSCRPERSTTRVGKHTLSTQTTSARGKTVQTQSMTTYRRHLSTPRFAVLAERDQGAWEHD